MTKPPSRVSFSRQLDGTLLAINNETWRIRHRTIASNGTVIWEMGMPPEDTEAFEREWNAFVAAMTDEGRKALEDWEAECSHEPLAKPSPSQ